jgi:hypothetical protein
VSFPVLAAGTHRFKAHNFQEDRRQFRCGLMATL